jgi:hypothetical protein
MTKLSYAVQGVGFLLIAYRLTHPWTSFRHFVEIYVGFLLSASSGFAAQGQDFDLRDVSNLMASAGLTSLYLYVPSDRFWKRRWPPRQPRPFERLLISKRRLILVLHFVLAPLLVFAWMAPGSDLLGLSRTSDPCQRVHRRAESSVGLRSGMEESSDVPRERRGFFDPDLIDRPNGTQGELAV